MNEDMLREELFKMNKERLVELFVKLKKINLKLCKRLDDAERQLIDLVDLDELINELPD